MLHEQPKSLAEIAAETRYPIDAFHFVHQGLDYTVRKLHENPEELDEAQRHVSGQQLCEGLREFATCRYGMLARTVLERWRITRTEDFGRIVFAMVEGGIMQATDNDRLADFEGAFDFDEAFLSRISLDEVPLEWDPASQAKA